MPSLVAVLLLILGVACGEPTGPKSPIAAYALSSVNAKTLPATMYADTGYALVVISGTITLTADMKYTSSITTRETVEGFVSTYVDSESGAWIEAAGGAITLSPASGGTRPAAWSGTQLTITATDGVFVYARSSN